VIEQECECEGAMCVSVGWHREKNGREKDQSKLGLWVMEWEHERTVVVSVSLI